MNRRIVGLLASLLLAATGTVAIAAYVRGADNRAKHKQELVGVLVVKKTVPPGTPAEQLGDRVGMQQVVRQDAANGAVTDVKQLAGRVTSVTLVPGEQLVSERFVDATAYRATGSGVQVPDGLLQTTIKLKPEQALGGVITPGTKVAVTVSFENKDQNPAQTQMILQSVLVTNVQQTQTTTSSSSSNTSTNGSDQKVGSAPSGDLLVTLALDGGSVERVVFGAERGSVWLSQEPDNAQTANTQVVTRENEFK